MQIATVTDANLLPPPDLLSEVISSLSPQYSRFELSPGRRSRGLVPHVPLRRAARPAGVAG